jgi:hypothetical protein
MLTRLSFCVFSVVALLIARLPAQPQETKAPAPQRLPANIYIDALLKSDLSTKYSKFGDRVELEVVRAFDGYKMQRLNAHSRLFGTVTMVRRSAKGQTAAVAIHIVEVRSKSGSQPVDGFIEGQVWIIHDWSGFTGGYRGMPSTSSGVTGGPEMSPFLEATVIYDPILGSILSSKRDFFLLKNRAQLSIRTR